MTSANADLIISRWSARFRGRIMPCATGRGGVGVKVAEGDGITPVGTFQIEWVWLRPDRIAARLPLKVRQTGLRDRWSEGPADADYNQPIRTPGPFSSETLRRPDPLYDAIAVLDYNRCPVIPGKGSAIFLHVWRKPRHPTAGCVAFSRRDLLWILARWTPRSRVIIR